MYADADPFTMQRMLTEPINVMAPRRRVCPKPLGQQISESINSFTDTISQAWREAEQSNKEYWAKKAEEVASQPTPSSPSGDFTPETPTDLPEELEAPPVPAPSASGQKFQVGTPKVGQSSGNPRTTAQQAPEPAPPQTKPEAPPPSDPQPMRPSTAEVSSPRKIDAPVPDATAPASGATSPVSRCSCTPPHAHGSIIRQRY